VVIGGVRLVLVAGADIKYASGYDQTLTVIEGIEVK
jgi:hypothetical protein